MNGVVKLYLSSSKKRKQARLILYGPPVISPNRTQRNIIVYEEIQSKTKAVDELCLSINDRISAHTITKLYNRNTGDVKRRISPFTSVFA
jgi:hypothetical protein